MRRALTLIVAALLMLAVATPGLAAVVIITAAAPLEDQSDDAVQTALDRAVGVAVEGAVQMGLRPVQLTDAAFLSDRVVVQVLATDEQPDEGDNPVPGMRPGEHLALDEGTS